MLGPYQLRLSVYGLQLANGRSVGQVLTSLPTAVSTCRDSVYVLSAAASLSVVSFRIVSLSGNP